jgi:hypothetical protein
MKVFNKRGESIEIGDNDTVPDGFGVHCPAFLMDGIQREIATSRVRIVDAAGRPAGSRPGFCFDASDDERAARASYEAHKNYLRDAWRSPLRSPITRQQQRLRSWQQAANWMFVTRKHSATKPTKRWSSKPRMRGVVRVQ